MICDSELDLGLLPPSPTCSLVAKVEKVESEVATLRSELRSQGRRLTVVVGVVSALAPHLVAVCEWLWSRRAESLLSLFW
jgi:hypothetical protein